MELTVLVDNNTHAGNCLISEHGLSFLIEEFDLKLLFDCGSSDAFIKNAYKMQIDLAQITDIVLSHSHIDHIGGFLSLQSLSHTLMFLSRAKVISLITKVITCQKKKWISFLILS